MSQCRFKIKIPCEILKDILKQQNQFSLTTSTVE